MTQGRPGIETRDSSDSPNERLTQPTKRRAVGNKEAHGRAGGARDPGGSPHEEARSPKTKRALA